MSDPLLTIRNHHSPSCGDPPIVNEDGRNTYIGYFENQHGEPFDERTGLTRIVMLELPSPRIWP